MRQAVVGAACLWLVLVAASTATSATGPKAESGPAVADADHLPPEFLPRKDYHVGKGADGVEIGDVNGDGKNELVVANRVTHNLSLFKQTGDPRDPLSKYQEIAVSWSPAVVAIGDINRDGLDDVAVAHYDDYVGSGKTNTFGVLYQNVTTHLLDPEKSYTFPSGQSSRAIAVGDANADGSVEVVVTNEVSGSTLFVWGWDPNSSTLKVVDSRSGVSPTVISITVGDLDDDNRSDVMTYGSRLQVLLQDATGKLGAPTNYGSTGGESGDIGDVNGDGLNDVAGNTAFSGEMEVWLQNAQNTLVKSGTHSCGSYTEDMEVDDLTRDGREDILCSSRDNSEAWLFQQNAQGQLDPPVKFMSIPGKWLNELAVGDLSGDGVTDFAGSNWGESGVNNPQWTTVSVWIHNHTAPVAPQVVATTPADGAANVSASANVEVSFSKAMDRSATEGAFSVSPALAGSFAWSASDSVVSFNPTANLATDTKHSVTVSRTAKDAQGTPMAADHVFSFTTEKSAPPAPPVVTATAPANHSQNVLASTSIQLTFSEAMDGAATEAAMSATPPITGSFLWDTSAKTTVWDPTADLAKDTTYTVTVSAAAKSAAGANLKAAHYFDFTVEKGATPTPPAVDLTTPLDGAKDVALDSKIEIAFTHDMVGTSLQNVFSVNQALTFTVESAGKLAKLNYQGTLESAKVYRIIVSKEATSTEGLTMTGPFEFSFTTGQLPDTTPPRVISTGPAHGAKGVEVSSKITITFSEAMDTAATDAAILLGPGAISGKSWNGGDTFVVLTAQLIAGTEYTVNVSTAAKDVAGNPIGSAHSFSFTTKSPPGTPPPLPSPGALDPVMVILLVGIVATVAVAAALAIRSRRRGKATERWAPAPGYQQQFTPQEYGPPPPG